MHSFASRIYLFIFFLRKKKTIIMGEFGAQWHQDQEKERSMSLITYLCGPLKIFDNLIGEENYDLHNSRLFFSHLKRSLNYRKTKMMKAVKWVK